MLVVQMSSRQAAAPVGGVWAAEVGRRIPGLNTEQAAQAAGSVLAALADNLQESDFRMFVAGLPAVMRVGLDDVQSARGSGPCVQEASLVMSVSARLPRFFPHHACLVTRVVLEILAEVSLPDAIGAIMAATPPRWRKLWPKSSLCSRDAA